MKLRDLAPGLTPEQLAECEVKVAVNWTGKKAKLAIVRGNNELVHERTMSKTTAPTEPATGTQAEFWQRHHNAWLD